MSEVNSQVSSIEANLNNSLISAPEGYKADADDVTAFKSGLGQLMFWDQVFLGRRQAD